MGLSSDSVAYRLSGGQVSDGFDEASFRLLWSRWQFRRWKFLLQKPVQLRRRLEAKNPIVAACAAGGNRIGDNRNPFQQQFGNASQRTHACRLVNQRRLG